MIYYFSVTRCLYILLSFSVNSTCNYNPFPLHPNLCVKLNFKFLQYVNPIRLEKDRKFEFIPQITS